MLKIFAATGDSVCCLQRIGNKSFAPFSHFPITYLFTNRKVRNAQTPLTAVVANAMVAKSTVVATEWNKVFGFSLKNVYYFIK